MAFFGYNKLLLLFACKYKCNYYICFMRFTKKPWDNQDDELLKEVSEIKEGGNNRNYRSSDELHKRLVKRCKLKGVNITDVVLTGIHRFVNGK